MYRPTQVAAGWLAASILLAGLAGGEARAQWTLTGTAVTPDARAGVPDVTVTLHPDSSVRAITDADGDFLLPWDGRKGWITLIPAQPGPDGKPWCKRRVFAAAEPGAEPGLVDLGPVIVSPRTRFAYQTQATPPRDTPRPRILRLPPPAQGEADTCRFRIRFQADPWGKATTADDLQADPAPEALRKAVLAWVLDVTWGVPAETICGPEAPYTGIDEVYYAWHDSVWVQLDKMEMHRIEVRQRAADRGIDTAR